MLMRFLSFAGVLLASWFLFKLFNALLSPFTTMLSFVKDFFTGTAQMNFFSSGKVAIEDAFEEFGSNLEAEGFATSDGQNDPLLMYNLARVQFADKLGLVGLARLTPPGFPTFDEWMAGEVGAVIG